MKKTGWITGTAAAFAAIIIILISAFQAAMYLDFGVYQKEYEKHDVLSDLDMTMEDTMKVTKEMMAYLKGKRPKLSVITTVEGRRQDFFNEQDRIHMKDVQELFIGGLRLRGAAAIVLIFGIGILIFLKEDVWKALRKCYQMALGVLAVLAVFLGVALMRDFTAVFTKFHEIFFDNDLWLFDPAKDYMIRMLPEGFFFDMVLRIGGYFIGGLIVTLAVLVFAEKYKEKSVRKKEDRKIEKKN